MYYYAASVATVFNFGVHSTETVCFSLSAFCVHTCFIFIHFSTLSYCLCKMTPATDFSLQVSVRSQCCWILSAQLLLLKHVFILKHNSSLPICLMHSRYLKKLFFIKYSTAVYTCNALKHFTKHRWLSYSHSFIDSNQPNLKTLNKLLDGLRSVATFIWV